MTEGPSKHRDPIFLAPDYFDIDFIDFDDQFGEMLRFDPRVQENYKKTFRLTLDERGPGFIDATGAWHRIPAATTKVYIRTIHCTFAGLDGRIQIEHLLIFCDVNGRVVLNLPSYGWPIGFLRELCSLAGWDTDFSNEQISMEQSWKQFPKITTAPIASVRGPLKNGTLIGGRLRRLFRGHPNELGL